MVAKGIEFATTPNCLIIEREDTFKGPLLPKGDRLKLFTNFVLIDIFKETGKS